MTSFYTKADQSKTNVILLRAHTIVRIHIERNCPVIKMRSVSVKMPQGLIDQLDKLLKRPAPNYSSRSDAIRRALRHLIEAEKPRPTIKQITPQYTIKEKVTNATQ